MTRPSPFGPEVERIDRHQFAERSQCDSADAFLSGTVVPFKSGTHEHNHNRKPLNVPVVITVIFSTIVGLLFIYSGLTRGVSRGHLIMAIGFLLSPLWYGVTYLLKFDRVNKRIAWSMVWVVTLTIIVTGFYKLYPQEFANVTAVF